MKHLLSLGLLVLIGCGSEGGSIQNATGASASELSDYLSRFTHEASLRGKTYSMDNLHIQFGFLADTSPGVRILGKCNELTTSITVNEDAWQYLSSQMKELVVFHELGHCILSLEHDSHFISVDSNMPESIMYPSLNEVDNFYYTHRDYYLNQLFKAEPL